MKKQKLAQRMKHLDTFLRCRDKTKFLCLCPDETIHCLCELCFNVLHGNILLKKNRQMSMIEQLILHYLADSTILVIEKRKLLNRVSRLLFPILQKEIIPALKKQVETKR